MATKKKKVLFSVPEPLLKKLDSAAKKNSRDRSAEMCVRLGVSLVEPKGQKAGASA